MKVAYIIDRYIPIGGASRTLTTMADSLELEEYQIFCRSIMGTEEVDKKVSVIKNATEILDFCITNNYDLIHWFKAEKVKLITSLLKLRRKRGITIPVITTICQKPSYQNLLLTNIEITDSAALVFIDSASYNDSLYHFLPNTSKRRIYFGTPISIYEEIKAIKRNENNTQQIIFGRGSTDNKIPSDFAEIFKQIDFPNKEFRVYGCNQRRLNEKSIYEKAHIYLYPPQPYKEWIKALSEFDIFLYQLPKNGYSSIDGVISQAMMFEIPVIYYGPSAPAELIENGKSGFIAQNKKELVKICDMLCRDKKKRIEIGRNARERFLKEFNFEKTKTEYMQLYHEVISNNSPTKVHIPISYKLIKCYRNLYWPIRKELFRFWNRKIKAAIQWK
jgi:glycosyltransferase involved in cell wall biosynthesis